MDAELQILKHLATDAQPTVAVIDEYCAEYKGLFKEVIPLGNEHEQKNRFQNAACNSASRMKSNEVNDWTCCALNCSSS